MADTLSKTAVAVDLPVAKPKTELETRLEAAKDRANWEWVTIPGTDLFGETHTGVSINFTQYLPAKDEKGQFTGEEQRYFVDPETAFEIRRLLKLRLDGDMRVLSPAPDKAMFNIMRKAGRGVPDSRG
jgi:hypothetical protein